LLVAASKVEGVVKLSENNQNLKQNGSVDKDRRMFVRGVLVGSAIVFTGSVLGLGRYTVPTAPSVQAFPRLLVVHASDLQTGQPQQYKYPLTNQPCIIVKVGQKAKFGVGPNQDIVSFSNICQHLGCIYNYSSTATCAGQPPFPGGHCPCHGSHYNFLDDGKVVCGPAPRPVPRVILEYDPSTDEIWAVGMGGPTVFGFNTGSDNVIYDLIGGAPVANGSQAQLIPLTPVPN
jgi:arsenite oxidase small subunit